LADAGIKSPQNHLNTFDTKATSPIKKDLSDLQSKIDQKMNELKSKQYQSVSYQSKPQ
jgi:hypothetical protein